MYLISPCCLCDVYPTLLGAFAKLRKPSGCLSAWNNSTVTGRILMRRDIWRFLENLSSFIKIWRD